LDDILIFSETLEELEQHVRTILRALNEAGSTSRSPSSSEKEVRFLSHIIDEKGSRPDPGLINKILEWSAPRNITELHGFVNLESHYRKYIPRFSDIILQLMDLMKGSPKKGSAIS
jgi:hypothetical protein